MFTKKPKNSFNTIKIQLSFTCSMRQKPKTHKQASVKIKKKHTFITFIKAKAFQCIVKTMNFIYNLYHNY